MRRSFSNIPIGWPQAQEHKTVSKNATTKEPNTKTRLATYTAMNSNNSDENRLERRVEGKREVIEIRYK